jgi:hypothetical protein
MVRRTIPPLRVTDEVTNPPVSSSSVGWSMPHQFPVAARLTI